MQISSYYTGRFGCPSVDASLDLHSDQIWWLKARAGVLLDPQWDEHKCICGVGGPSLTHVLWECPSIKYDELGLEGLDLGAEYSAPDLTEFWTEFIRNSSERLNFGGYVRRVFASFHNQIHQLTRSNSGLITTRDKIYSKNTLHTG